MKLNIYWLTVELENGNGTETFCFASEAEREKAMADYITARIQEVRDDNEPAAEQALADECERLLAAGDFETAWGLFRDGGEADALCNPDDCFWWGEDEVSTPLGLDGNTLSDLAAWATRWGWDARQGNSFWSWVTLALVGAHSYELERESEKAKASQFNLSLGARLLKWRRAKGLTQEGAAREIGVPFRTYQDTERGVSEPEGFGRALLLKMLDNHEKEQNSNTEHTTQND